MTNFKPANAFASHPLTLWLSILQEQTKLLRSIQKNLPTQLTQAIRHCLISEQQLIIYVDSASWASQLRFLQDKIMAGLIESGVTHVKGLQIRLAANPQNPLKKRTIKLPSETVLSALKNSYGDNTEDALAQALNKLTRTLEKRLSAKS